ncbi:hypothetical protein C8Q76DRAFT_761790 [Earliella scabrosa]|nr:hypothetical protein C8Q76DRAFT_761790 [Earliella scabrosa]
MAINAEGATMTTASTESGVIQPEIVDYDIASDEREEARPSTVSVFRPNDIVRDGKTLRRIEVVVPRWQNVLRHKARQRETGTRHDNQPAQVQPEQETDAESINGLRVKPEPVDDELPMQLDHGAPGSAEALRQAVEEMRNRDVKIKKELLFNDEFLLNALTWEGINYRYPISLPAEISERGFRRAYIASLYGGNIQETFPHPRKDMLEWHKLDDWMFLTLDYNPHAPTRPGFSGLFFSGGRAVDNWTAIQRTFVRLKPSHWVYMGQYRMRAGTSLTSTLWKEQTEIVKRTWARGFLTKEWGYSTCVRLWSRRQNGADYELTKEDFKNAESNFKQIRGSLTEDDIIQAFDDGVEEMGTYRMTCVEYDEDFVRILARNADRWTPPPAKHLKRKQATDTKQQGAQKKNRSSKRSAAINVASPADIEVEDDDPDL